MSVKPKTERFMQKVGDKSMNWLELFYYQDLREWDFLRL